MKISKRLLAVLMSVVMVLTIVPLGLFAFADGETPEPRTETKTIEIDSIAELQLIGNDPAYPAAPTKATAADGAEVTTNYIYKITKDLNAVDENFENWFKDNQIGAYIILENEGAPYYTPVGEGATYDSKNNYAVYDDVNKRYMAISKESDPFATLVDDDPMPEGEYFIYNGRESFDTEPLTPEEKALLIEKAGIASTADFTPIKSLDDVTIDGAYAEGKAAIISGLTIQGATNDGTTYAGLVAVAEGGTVIKNLVLDSTCVISASGDGDVRVGSFIAYGPVASLDNVKSSAKIDVSNKLYAAKSAEDTANKCKTNVGGLAGSGLILTVKNSSFDGKINFAYDPASFTGVALKDIYEKAVVNLGGIIGYAGLIAKTCTANPTITSTYLGVAVNAGKISGTDNDYTLLEAYTSDAQTYPNTENGYQKADIFDVAVSTEPDENGYQLVNATDTASSITYAYIRTPVCGHASGSLTTIPANDATCAADGNIEYVQCNDCEKYFKDSTCKEEITLDQTVISKDTIAHTLGEPVKAKDATCTETGIAYDYYQCSVCNKYFKDAEGTQEVKENAWVTKALGHSWDAGEVTKEPTYDEEGIKTFHCTRDGCTETKTEPIAKKTPPSVSPKSGSGYKATTTGGKNTIILPNPSSKSGTTVSTFTSNLQSGYTYVVKDASGKTVTSGPVGTNYTVEIKVDGKLYAKTTIIVRGDTDCNGKISSMDYVKVKNHIRKTTLITDAIIQVAADANNDGNIKATDYTRIKNIMRKG